MGLWYATHVAAQEDVRTAEAVRARVDHNGPRHLIARHRGLAARNGIRQDSVAHRVRNGLHTGSKVRSDLHRELVAQKIFNGQHRGLKVHNGLPREPAALMVFNDPQRELREYIGLRQDLAVLIGQWALKVQQPDLVDNLEVNLARKLVVLGRMHQIRSMLSSNLGKSYHKESIFCNHPIPSIVSAV